MKPVFARIQQLSMSVSRRRWLPWLNRAVPLPQTRQPDDYFPDGNMEGTVGGALEKRVIEVAREVMKTGEPQRFILNSVNRPASVGGVCGGESGVFIEPVGTPPRLLIFGAGHVGQILSQMARELDLQIVVYDDREEFATPDRFRKMYR